MSRQRNQERRRLNARGAEMVHVPNETPVGDQKSRTGGPKYIALRTSDGALYARDGDTRVIRHIVAKKRGKAARRADKEARRAARAAAQVQEDRDLAEALAVLGAPVTLAERSRMHGELSANSLTGVGADRIIVDDQMEVRHEVSAEQAGSDQTGPASPISEGII